MIIMLVVVCGGEDNDDHYPGVCWDVDDGNGEFGDNGNISLAPSIAAHRRLVLSQRDCNGRRKQRL